MRRGKWTRRLRWALPLALGVGAVALAMLSSGIRREAQSPYPLLATASYEPLLASMHRAGQEVGGGLEIPLEIPFAPGETLSEVLEGLELAPSEVQGVVEELAKHADLRRIRPQDRYAIIREPGAGLKAFELTVDGRGRAAVAHSSRGWESEWRPFTRRVEVRRVHGTLEDFLEGALRAAGGEPGVAYLMADVLQWDLDFTRDLRLGDSFDVLYESVFLDGAYHSLGDILALSYENQGRRLEAYRYGEGDQHGYYDAEGRPLRKMFLRSPMKYSRVTSRFSKRRFHPVLKQYRPHHGVDYGAPTGTPVRVTANGVVVSAGWNGGGGRTVKVRHPNGYVSSYLHLSRYAKNARAGKRVSQGEVIGYVGSSGLATGPHLDYRLQENGRWIDPLSLKSVPADPVKQDDMPAYLAERDLLRRALWEGHPYELPAEVAGDFSLAAKPQPRGSLGGH